MKVSELFYKCAFLNDYETAGKDVNYKFRVDRDSLVIYFQGSSSLTDWIRNFMFKKRPYKDMPIPYRVHRGFLKAWKEVEDIIIKKVTEMSGTRPQEMFYKFRDITIVGYSHGAALAQLCHECVWFHRPDLRNSLHFVTYAFESPRFFGHFRIKKELSERWTNCMVFRTNNDIITHLPPRVFGYCDVNKVCPLEINLNVVKQLQKKFPKCVMSHHPDVVYAALLELEKKLYD